MNIYTLPLSDYDLEQLYIEMEKKNPAGKQGKRRNNADQVPRTGYVRKVVPDSYSIIRGLKCQTAIL